MTATITDLLRYPIKGFTPECIVEAELSPGAGFPCDRLFAVEDGPSGFDPEAPGFIPKQRFTVLAKIARVAKVRTVYDALAGQLRADAPHAPPFHAPIASEAGRTSFAAWLTDVLGEEARGPLRMIDGRGHRFFDDPRGHVSILNLASVSDLAAAIGRPIDPARFRANIHVKDWPAWIENGWTGRRVRLGTAEADVVGPITRCAATMVDPAAGERDIDIPAALHGRYGHILCGVYVQITSAGAVRTGDAATLIDA